jgi:hypothetical protein
VFDSAAGAALLLSLAQAASPSAVTPGPAPRIHAGVRSGAAWIAGTSPAMTAGLALPLSARPHRLLGFDCAPDEFELKDGCSRSRRLRRRASRILDFEFIRRIAPPRKQ